jgi:hypothetical protein
MRETCARVLAAALITGVFGAVAGTSTLFGTPSEPTQRLAAPPAALERSVPITVAPTPVRPHRKAARHVPKARVQTISRPVRHAVVARRLVVIHTKPKPEPKRMRPAAPRELASSSTPTAPAAEPGAPEAAAPPVENGGDDKERPGHAYGHDKEHHEGHGHQEHAE